MNDRHEHEPQRGHDIYEEMACAFVLGALAEPDLSEFRRHVSAGCEQCSRLHPELEAVANALLIAVPPVTPPPGLRTEILRAAGVSEPATSHWREAEPGDRRPSRKREPLAVALALAASLLLAIVSWRTLDLRGELVEARRRAGVAESEVERLTGELARLNTTAGEQAALIDLLRRPGSGLVTLASLKPAPNSSGRVLWDPKAGHGYLWVLALPQDPAGKDYQLWAIIEGKPVSAGVFSVAADGSALVPLLDIRPDSRVAAFAITLEPAGGLPQPSGEMVLLGQTGA